MLKKLCVLHALGIEAAPCILENHGSGQEACALGTGRASIHNLQEANSVVFCNVSLAPSTDDFI